MADMASEDVSVTELRAADYEFASRFGQLVSKCALDIIEESQDWEIQKRALIWRMYTAPQARAAAFNQDPFAGLLELWALAGQQRALFTEGEGKDAFGDHQACVTATAIQLEQEAEELAAKVMPEQNVDRVKQRVAEWVAAHPIEGRLFVRPTARADLAALVHVEGQGGLKAVASMEETLRDLNDRLSILSVQMPFEARWQAEYLIHSLFEERLTEPTDTLVESMNAITAFLGEFETALGNQTTRLLDAFSLEREAAFVAIEEERKQILEALEGERVAVLDSVDAQVDEALSRFELTGRGLIDHFFGRLIGILVAIGIFIFIIVAVLIGALRSRTPAPAPPPPRIPESDEN
ncbi:MAG: hypothetical protein O7F08_03270 [Deltaproteobacteria bacterium]|nr:hypothetical protein [Deltaproteobacteria bacterium]